MFDRDRVLARLDAESAELSLRAIIDVRRMAPAGYGAVLAFPGETPRTPAEWTSGSHPTHAEAVEARLLATALEARERIPPERFLAIRVSAGALLGSALWRVFEAAGDLTGVIVSVTHAAESAGAVPAREPLERLRDAGAAIAVDETGGGYASLREIVALRPGYIRVGGMFTAEVDRDPARAAVIEALMAVSSRIGARFVAGEIPGEPELHTLIRLGVQLVQGPVLGPPAPHPLDLSDEARARIAAACVPEHDEPTIEALVEPVEPLSVAAGLADIADRFLADPRNDVLVAVDERGVPVFVIERAAVLRGDAFEHEPTIVAPASLLREVARRAAARPQLDRFVPLVCCDAEGRYRGIVRVDRLLNELAGDAPVSGP